MLMIRSLSQRYGLLVSRMLGAVVLTQRDHPIFSVEMLDRFSDPNSMIQFNLLGCGRVCWHVVMIILQMQSLVIIS